MRFQYFLILICLLIISCKSDDSTGPTPDLTGKYIIPANTSDTVLFVRSSVDNMEIPIVISIPNTQSIDRPGVVVLHGSGGNWVDEDTDNDGMADIITEWELSSQNMAWKAIFDEENIVSAYPGSYYPRGAIENEGDWKNPPLQFEISATFIRNHDAYLTLDVLSKLVRPDGTEIVDAASVGLLGFSHGATAVQSTLFDTDIIPNDWQWRQRYSGVDYFNEILPPPLKPTVGFVGGVMYYPGSFHNSYYGNPCSGTSIFQTYADFIIHLPSEDGLTANSLCMLQTVSDNGGGIATLYEYQGAAHGFDNKSTGIDGDASVLARERTMSFLKGKLGVQ